MNIKTRIASVLTLAVLCPGSAWALDTAKLDRFFDRLDEKNKTMGSLVVAKDGEVVYARAVGYERIEGAEKKALTAGSRFRIGSVTKPFTATMVFQLVEEGKLKLGDTLDRFFPQVSNAKDITIEQMLAHRSGIYDLTDDPGYRASKVKARTQAETLAAILGGKPVFAPGERREYSNSNYVLLGLIIERVTRQSYAEALEARIVSKVGLTDTYVGVGQADAGKNEAFSYIYAGEWKEEASTDMSVPGGAGAIVSTPADLAKFMEALFDLKLVSRQSLERMTEGQMGLEKRELEGRTFYRHGGAMDAYRTLLLYLPEDKMAIAYAQNGMNLPAIRVVGAVLATHWNRPFEIPTFESLEVSPEVLERYVGVYSSPDAPMRMTVTRDGGTLFAQPSGQSAVPLEATAENKFKFDPAGADLEFDAGKGQLILKRRGRETVLTREK